MGVHERFSTIIENMSQDNVTFEYVKRKLQNDDEKLKSSSSNNVTSKSDPMTFQASKSKLVCFLCGKPGHFKKQCYLNKSRHSNHSNRGRNSSYSRGKHSFRGRPGFSHGQASSPTYQRKPPFGANLCEDSSETKDNEKSVSFYCGHESQHGHVEEIYYP